MYNISTETQWLYRNTLIVKIYNTFFKDTLRLLIYLTEVQNIIHR